MNRTDRLVAMVLHLQGRRVVRAEELAEVFEISDRTVYRDIAALGEAGVPVVGEAGVGYSLARGYHLPPVMFTGDEALAMAVGEGLVRAMTDSSVAEPMGSALAKIRSVLPADHKDVLERLDRATAVLDPQGGTAPDGDLLLSVQRAAISRAVLDMRYRDRTGTPTTRQIEPLGVLFFNQSWYVVAWCRLREGLRHFRVDRMVSIKRTGERCPVRDDFTLAGHIESERHPGKQAVEVVVRMIPGAADGVRRERWLEVVSERQLSEREVEMKLRVHSIEAAAWWVLSRAGTVEAVAPEALRGEVATQAEALAKKHREPISS